MRLLRYQALRSFCIRSIRAAENEGCVLLRSSSGFLFCILFVFACDYNTGVAAYLLSASRGRGGGGAVLGCDMMVRMFSDTE